MVLVSTSGADFGTAAICCRVSSSALSVCTRRAISASLGAVRVNVVSGDGVVGVAGVHSFRSRKKCMFISGVKRHKQRIMLAERKKKKKGEKEQRSKGAKEQRIKGSKDQRIKGAQGHRGKKGKKKRRKKKGKKEKLRLSIWVFIHCRGPILLTVSLDTTCPSNTKSRDSTDFHHNSSPLPNQPRRLLPGVQSMNRVSADTTRGFGSISTQRAKGST